MNSFISFTSSNNEWCLAVVANLKWTPTFVELNLFFICARKKYFIDKLKRRRHRKATSDTCIQSLFLQGLIIKSFDIGQGENSVKDYFPSLDGAE